MIFNWNDCYIWVRIRTIIIFCYTTAIDLVQCSRFSDPFTISRIPRVVLGARCRSLPGPAARMPWLMNRFVSSLTSERVKRPRRSVASSPQASDLAGRNSLFNSVEQRVCTLLAACSVGPWTLWKPQAPQCPFKGCLVSNKWLFMNKWNALASTKAPSCTHMPLNRFLLVSRGIFERLPPTNSSSNGRKGKSDS